MHPWSTPGAAAFAVKHTKASRRSSKPILRSIVGISCTLSTLLRKPWKSLPLNRQVDSLYNDPARPRSLRHLAVGDHRRGNGDLARPREP
jgi:hypothetical protein